MSSSSSPFDGNDAIRAISHHGSVLWDATRGLLAAYIIDTRGPAARAAAPAWEDLSVDARAAFLLLISEPVGELIAAVEHITEHHT